MMTFHCYQLETLTRLYLYFLASFWWYFALAMICKNHYLSFIFLAIQVSRLVFLQDVVFKKTKKFSFKLSVLFRLDIITIKPNFFIQNIISWYHMFFL